MKLNQKTSSIASDCSQFFKAFLKKVASAILADVEPGFQPGGFSVENVLRVATTERPGGFVAFSGRREADLHGRQGCLPLHSQTGANPLRDLLPAR